MISDLDFPQIHVFDVHMEISLRVQQPASRLYRTVVARAAHATAGEQLHERLCALWGTHEYRWHINGQDVRELELGSYPLVQGAMVQACPYPQTPKKLPLHEPSPFTLSIIHGPDSQRSIPLTRGSWSIGKLDTDLEIHDPALKEIEGHLAITPEGAFFRSATHTASLEPGEIFTLGNSSLVLDRAAEQPTSYQEPAIQELDVPAPRSKAALLALVAVPLLLGGIIFWLTSMWFILLMSLASSLLMVIHYLIQGQEGTKVRRKLRDIANHELSAQRNYRGALLRNDLSRLYLGTSTRQLKVRAKNREIHRVPLLEAAPFSLTLEELQPLFSALPIGTQRLILVQLLQGHTPIYILPSTLASTAATKIYAEFFDPLLASPQVSTIDVADLHHLAPGVVLAEQNNHGSAGAHTFLSLTHLQQHLPPARVLGHEEIKFDQISYNHYVKLLSTLTTEAETPMSETTYEDLTATSNNPYYTDPTSPTSSLKNQLWASEVSMYLGAAVGSPSSIHLGLDSSGPHFLCAGTTGSGKSQLLRSLLWSMVLNYPPQRVSFLLIDFKGGAGLAPLSAAPHTISFVNDLDSSLLERTMKYLMADLTRRKQLFADLQISSYQDYIAACHAKNHAPEIPELIVCIDEFRMLVDEYPDLMQEFMRIAAVGRSLGYHLILATQRPQGAISQDIRTNISTSICLRVSSPQDSYNILGSEEASAISWQHPGRGYIKNSELPLQEFQAPAITGSHFPEESKECSLTFISTTPEATSRNSSESSSVHLWSDADLKNFNLALGAQLSQHQAAPVYCPIPPLPTAPKISQPTSYEAARTQAAELLLGCLEISELGYQEPYIWRQEEGPALIVATGSERYSALKTTVADALNHNFDVVLLSASEQAAEHISNGIPSNLPLACYTLKDLDYIRSILAELTLHPASRPTLLIIDALDHLYEALSPYPASETHLQELLSPAGSSQVLILCTSTRLPRANINQLFSLFFFSRSAIEADPMLAHRKDYPRPAVTFLTATGHRIEALSKGQVAAGTFIWSRYDRQAFKNFCLTYESQAINRQHPWQQLPTEVSVADIATEPTEEKLICGVLRDGTPAALPRTRGKILAVSGARKSGKSTLLATIVQANPQHSFLMISDAYSTTPNDLEKAFERATASPQGHRAHPILLIDDLEQLDTSCQTWVLSHREKIQQIIATFTPWPRWTSSPILTAVQGSATGLVLGPQNVADLSFWNIPKVPLDLKTAGKVPPGRGVIIHETGEFAFQVAHPK